MEQITRALSNVEAQQRAIARVGADLAKRVIQVHAVDDAGRVVCRRALPREKFLAWCTRLPAHCGGHGDQFWVRTIGPRD